MSTAQLPFKRGNAMAYAVAWGTALVLLCVGSMRFATYNPLSCRQTWRMESLSREMKSISVAGISGTQKRQYGEASEVYSTWRTPKHTAIEWARRPSSKHTNKSCGLAPLLSRKWIRAKHITEIH